MSDVAEFSSFDDVTTCPHCGYQYVHHMPPAVYYVRGEDDPVVEVWAGSKSRHAFNRQSRNPSARRGSVEIELWCEGCHAHSAIQFVQHKGSTFIRWAADGQTPKPAVLVDAEEYRTLLRGRSRQARRTW